MNAKISLHQGVKDSSPGSSWSRYSSLSGQLQEVGGCEGRGWMEYLPQQSQDRCATTAPSCHLSFLLRLSFSSLFPTESSLFPIYLFSKPVSKPVQRLVRKLAASEI